MKAEKGNHSSQISSEWLRIFSSVALSFSVTCFTNRNVREIAKMKVKRDFDRIFSCSQFSTKVDLKIKFMKYNVEKKLIKKNRCDYHEIVMGVFYIRIQIE